MDDKELDKMVKDIEPEAIETDGSVEDIEEPATEDTVETEVTQAPEPASEGSSGGRKFILIAVIVLVIAGLGGLGAWAYLDGQSARSQVTSLKQGLDAARADAAKLRADAALGDTTSGKDFVDDAEVSAMALNTVEAFMSTKGVTRMTYEAKVLYLDAEFARVGVDYTVPDPTNGKTKPSGKGETFFFKKVSRGEGDKAIKSWALIAINPMTTDEMTSLKNRYGVTEKAISESNPQ